MKPEFIVDDDDPFESGPVLGSKPPRTGMASWLQRAGIGLGLLAVAICGYGSSAGWFKTPRWPFASPNENSGAATESKGLSSIRQAPSAADPQAANPSPPVGKILSPAPNPPPLAALVPETSLEIIAECQRVARHLEQVFPGALEAREMQARVEFQLGAIEKARAIWAEVLTVEPNYVHALRGLGDVCTLNGELKEAVQYFRRAVLADPQDLTRQVTLGVALLQAAEVDQAIEVLQAVLASAPAHVGAHAELARALSQAGQYEVARTHFEAALKEESRLTDPAKVHFGLATVLQRLGDKEQAQVEQAAYSRLRGSSHVQREAERRDYDDVQAIGLDAARLYVDMARVYLAGGQVGSAELLLLRASRMNPQDIDCRQALAFLALNQDRPHDAVRWLREVAELRPDDFTIVAEIARLYVQVQVPDSAERCLLDFLTEQPKSQDALRALAELYRVVKLDRDKAVEYARAAVDVEPTAENYSSLASTLDFAENVPEALDALQRAVELAPQNAVYAQRLALLREMQTASDDDAAAVDE